MRTLQPFAPFIMVLFILVLAAMLIREKRAGRWKRPWSFPVAMTLLSVALVLTMLGKILELMGM
jgi:hypothetical protein